MGGWCDGAWRAAVAAAVIAAALLPPSIGAAADPPTPSRSHWYERDWDYAEKISNEWDGNSLDEFLPDRTGDFILPWETISDQVAIGLGRAPLRARALPDGRRLLWGCRWQSCTEKAAVVVSPEGKVEAAALIHSRCHFTAYPVRRSNRWRKSNYTCDIHRRTLTVFVHVEQTYRPAFERWAEAVTGERLPVEIYWV